jgi:hypothetical protein
MESPGVGTSGGDALAGDPKHVEGSFQVPAKATIFGFDDAIVRAVIIPRGRAWRAGGAARTMGVFVVVAPFVAIVPPHVVWLMGALATGAFLARRRYVERFTLVSVDGACPNCGTKLSVKPTRLLTPHQIPCDTCHYTSLLRLPEGTLEKNAAE